MEEDVVKKKLVILVMLLIHSTIWSFGQDALKVIGIEVNGVKEVPIEVIEDIMSLEDGSNFEAEKMIEDHINLKEKEYIKDVKIYPQIEKDGIKVIVQIEEEEDSKELLKAEDIIPLSEQEKIDKSLTVKRVEVSGNTNIPSDELMKYISVKVGGYFSKTKTIDSKNRLLKSGYFRDVTPDVTKYGDGIFIKYTVLENPIIKGIKIEGNTLFEDEELIKLLRTKQDKIYNINDLRKDKDKIDAHYREAGYGLAEVIDMGLDNDMNLVIQVSEGVVREIVFKKIVKKEKGKRRNPEQVKLKTKDFVLDRELVLEEGKPFETKKFETTARNLFRLGHFKNVTQEFEDIPGDPDGKRVVILLDEQRTAQYQGTISYGSAIGLVGSVGVEDKNFRGKGQTLALNFELGEDNRKTYEFSFNDPWLKGTERFSYGWSVYRREYEDDDSVEAYHVKKEGFRLSGGKALTDTIRVRLGTKLEFVTEQDEEKTNSYDYTTVSLIPALIYDTRNNYYTATRGFYASYSVEVGKILEEGNFYINELELRKYHGGLFEKNTFAYRGMLGVGTENLRDSQKFRVGGGNSIRGYQYGDFKGNYQLYANFENRTKLDDNFEFVAFYDIGRAWDTGSTSIDDTKLFKDIKQSYGIGLRIQTPLGPLRFDYGWPIGDEEASGGEFYFNIGHLF